MINKDQVAKELSFSRRPTMWIMKITDYNPRNTRNVFDNLYVSQRIDVIGYFHNPSDKAYGRYMGYWKDMKPGDLIVILEAHNKVHGVVAVISDHNGDYQANEPKYFQFRKKVHLVYDFKRDGKLYTGGREYYESSHRTNIDCIISTQKGAKAAKAIVDEVFEMIKEKYEKERPVIMTKILKSHKS